MTLMFEIITCRNFRGVLKVHRQLIINREGAKFAKILFLGFLGALRGFAVQFSKI